MVVFPTFFMHNAPAPSNRASTGCLPPHVYSIGLETNWCLCNDVFFLYGKYTEALAGMENHVNWLSYIAYTAFCWSALTNQYILESTGWIQFDQLET